VGVVGGVEIWVDGVVEVNVDAEVERVIPVVDGGVDDFFALFPSRAFFNRLLNPPDLSFSAGSGEAAIVPWERGEGRGMLIF